MKRSRAIKRDNITRSDIAEAVLNKQYEYDHKDDQAVFMDKKYLERKLEVM